MRRLLVAFLGVALLAIAAPAQAAPDVEQTLCPRMESGPPGTTFAVTGPGVFVGGWNASGKHADLCFRGVGALGGPTKLTATWTSPWSRSMDYLSKGTYDFNNVNPNSTVIVTVSSRFQVRDHKWDRWMRLFEQRIPQPLGGGAAGWGEGIAFGTTGRAPSSFKPPAIRWQWRLEISLTGPVAIDMRSELSSK
jgi:hypothetical protein